MGHTKRSPPQVGFTVSSLMGQTEIGGTAGTAGTSSGHADSARPPLGNTQWDTPHRGLMGLSILPHRQMIQ